jgi:hypothetical protein
MNSLAKVAGVAAIFIALIFASFAFRLDYKGFWLFRGDQTWPTDVRNYVYGSCIESLTNGLQPGYCECWTGYLEAEVRYTGNPNDNLLEAARWMKDHKRDLEEKYKPAWRECRSVGAGKIRTDLVGS